MLNEERKHSRDLVQQSVAVTKEEMKEYLQEQRKVRLFLPVLHHSVVY